MHQTTVRCLRLVLQVHAAQAAQGIPLGHAKQITHETLARIGAEKMHRTIVRCLHPSKQSNY